MPEQTPSQTVGPFFHFGLIAGGSNVLVNDRTLGQRIRLFGIVLDGNDLPVPDALVEIWQADANGRFHHPADPDGAQADPNFRGFGRADTLDAGRYWFETIKPGRVPGRDGQLQAPHLNVRVFARGLLIQALTRLYFADESANATDAVLNAIPDPKWRQTLLATRQDVGGRCTYRFDIRLQGEQQTVFFEY